MNSEQNAREAMEVWREASDAATGNAVKWKPKADQAAASVIAAKLAEKDAEIARLREALERGIEALSQEQFHPDDPECELCRVADLMRQALKPESPDHD